MLNSPRIWLDRELAAFGKSLPPNALVLDAGAGDQRYKSKVAHCRYEAADFEQVNKKYAKSTYTCDLKKIPVEDGRFDAVIFTQVMEHLPDPAAVVKELHRVLKPGGRLFYSGPFWYEEHEQPYDFYRYTQFAVRHLFESAGFQICELRWMDGYMATVAHQLRRMRRSLPLTPSGYGGGFGGLFRLALFTLFRVPCALLAPLAAASDAKFRYTARGFPMNYLAIVERPTADH
jgi:SAM-dependent methyltransferase